MELKPDPTWDADHPGIPYCRTKCPHYVKTAMEPWSVEECEAMQHISGLPGMCWECAICLPALALGKGEDKE